MKKYFSISKILIIFLVIFASTAIAYMVLSGFIRSSGYLTKNANTADFNDGFTYADGSSPQIAGNRITVDLENESAAIQKTVSTDITDKYISFRIKARYVSVKVNGNLIYDKYSESCSSTNPLMNTYYMIELPDLHKGDIIELTVERSGLDTLTFEMFSCGSVNDILVYNLKHSLIFIAACISCEIISIISLVFFLRLVFGGNKANGFSFLWLSMFSLLSSIWISCDCGVIYFLSFGQLMINMLNTVSLILLPLTFIQFLKNALKLNSKFSDYLCLVNIVVGLLNVILYIAGKMDIEQWLTVYHLIMYMYIGYIIYNFKEIKEQLSILTIHSLTIFCLCCVMNLLSFYFFPQNSRSIFYCLGIIIFSILMLIRTMQNYASITQAMETVNLLKMEVYSMQKHIKTFQEVNTQVRIVRHDMRHYMNMLNVCLTEKRYDEMQQIIDSVSNNLDVRLEGYVIHNFTDKPVIDTILSYYKYKADKSGVNFKISMTLPLENRIDDMDFALLLTNLLDNAVNAAEKVLTGSSRFVEIKDRTNGSQYFLEISNSCQDNVIINDVSGFPETDNKDGHGFGTKSAYSILKKYKLNYSCSNENNIFTFQMLV